MDKAKKKKKEISDSRSALVVQSNHLIRDVRTLRYGLTTQQQRIIVYLISKVCKDDKELKRVKFNISEYCDVCNLQKNGTEFERIKESLKSLRDKSYWIKNDDGDEILFAWVDTLVIRKNKSVEVILSEALRPYLLNLSQSFTAYELINALCLRQKYSLRMYELLKSYMWLGKWQTSVKNFRETMYLKEKYPLFKELKRNVIDCSLNEINKYCDITVTYETIKKGRSINEIVFYIQEKRGVQLTMDLMLNQEERLAIRKRQNNG